MCSRAIIYKVYSTTSERTSLESTCVPEVAVFYLAGVHAFKAGVIPTMRWKMKFSLQLHTSLKKENKLNKTAAQDEKMLTTIIQHD